MRRSRLAVVLSVGLGLAGITLAAEDLMMPPGSLQKIVDVRAVHAQPDQVSGVLVNLSSRAVRSIRVRIDSSWLWTDERHPGEDNPGRSIVYAVPGEIQPGGSQPFTYRADTPLPQRSDGRFETHVAIVGLEQDG